MEEDEGLNGWTFLEEADTAGQADHNQPEIIADSESDGFGERSQDEEISKGGIPVDGPEVWSQILGLLQKVGLTEERLAHQHDQESELLSQLWQNWE